jgi:hypothetical protein
VSGDWQEYSRTGGGLEGGGTGDCGVFGGGGQGSFFFESYWVDAGEFLIGLLLQLYCIVFHFVSLDCDPKCFIVHMIQF